MHTSSDTVNISIKRSTIMALICISVFVIVAILLTLAALSSKTDRLLKITDTYTAEYTKRFMEVNQKFQLLDDKFTTITASPSTILKAAGHFQYEPVTQTILFQPGNFEQNIEIADMINKYDVYFFDIRFTNGRVVRSFMRPELPVPDAFSK